MHDLVWDFSKTIGFLFTKCDRIICNVPCRLRHKVLHFMMIAIPLSFQLMRRNVMLIHNENALWEDTVTAICLLPRMNKTINLDIWWEIIRSFVWFFMLSIDVLNCVKKLVCISILNNFRYRNGVDVLHSPRTIWETCPLIIARFFYNEDELK